MSSLQQIIEDITSFIANPDEVIQRDIEGIKSKWKHYLYRLYYLTEGDFKFTQIIKSTMLNKINQFFDDIYGFDVKERHSTLNNLLENEEIKKDIEKLISTAL